MSRLFDVSVLIDRAQQRAELENSDLISDNEWKGMLSTVYGELYGALVESGMRYFEAEQTISTDGTNDYNLPAAYLSTIGVDQLVNASSGERRALRELMAQERNYGSSVRSASQATHYAIVGSEIILYPTPPSGKTYYHVYVPQPTDLSAASDGTDVDVVTPDGESFVIWGLAVLALTKDDSDPRFAASERDKARARLDDWAYMRALNTPRRRIVEEDDFDRGYLDGDWWPPRGGW